MSDNIATLSEVELAELIANASKELEAKRHGKKRETILKIKELASSIGMHVEISEGDKKPTTRKGTSVPVKYRDPNNAKNAWTGRGMKPRWLTAYLEQGRSQEEFRV
ncbi:H-NS family nucleoid-associated regulatory protein [Methylomagnum ishizawai]|uniref:DNA-binding protein H-NS n=1 Tax=Methylomagnum ishizawai TaxID=1760988 RepID=A0A1Y6D8D7_9GAMM|nr:H-NS histone family protein [Methylomagnum ishizawai]BBL76226.1 DNA-binding protein [Methylomagnum ishizawai]SMF96504.1 DNA-binding protein H-NS [Methylomagnum ishizawai]